MINNIIPAIRNELQNSVDARTKESAQNFFKETVVFYGVKTALVNKIADKYFKEVKNAGKTAIFSLCEELLKSDYSEESFIAFEWAYRVRNEFKPGDIEVFERWLTTYVNNWAKCDTLCNHTIGSFITSYPQYIKTLLEWTRSKNRWVRRASAVTLIIPAKKGLFLEDAFRIADRLLRDEDDLVQKGYGWMLKAASQAHQKEVFDYVMKHRKVMPRTALRYAIEKMPADLKRKAMEKPVNPNTSS